MWVYYPYEFWAAESEPGLRISPSLGEMREILEISVSVKAILIYAILNKTIMFLRISSRLVRISLLNFSRVPQNSTSLGESV